MRHDACEARRSGGSTIGLSLIAAPGRLVALLILAQLVLWTAVPALVNTSLPLDVVREGLAWGREWQLGYSKHPPLASWLVEVAFDALGDWGPYLLSQIAVAVTYGFVFLIGRRLLDPARAAAGTLLLTGVFYFSWPTPEFNHNLAQMPFWAMAAYFFLRAVTTPRLLWWMLLGAALGVGALTKYTIAVLGFIMALALVATPAWRPLLLALDPWLAAGLALAILAPHLAWLAAHHFETLQYAADRAGRSGTLGARLAEPLTFLAAQAADQAGLLALLAGAGLIGPGALRLRERWRDPSFRFLAILALAPAGLVALGSLLSGFGLRDMWGMPMWDLSGLFAVKLTEARWRRASLTRLALGAALFLLLVPAVYAAVAEAGAWRARPLRTEWPDRAVSAELARAWQNETGCPLRIVAGDSWIAGLVAMRAAPRPSVMLDAEFATSPWITPARLTREGALALWDARTERAPPPALARLPGFRAAGTMSFAWPHAPRRPPLVVGWGIVPPAQGCAGR